jgi:hypothetical protein
MNRDEVDFANEDLGLAPVHGDEIEGDDFDAFNEDTFGAEDVWVEDDHEEVIDAFRSKISLVRLEFIQELRNISASQFTLIDCPRHGLDWKHIQSQSQKLLYWFL